jgi:hypothetical protein
MTIEQIRAKAEAWRTDFDAAGEDLDQAVESFVENTDLERSTADDLHEYLERLIEQIRAA